MSIEQQIRQIVSDLRYQLPIGPTTMAACDCGRRGSRGGRRCRQCLHEDLAELVRPELAADFVQAAEAARFAEAALYQEAGKDEGRRMKDEEGTMRQSDNETIGKGGQSITPTTLIAIPVLEACLEYLYELSAAWSWKRGTTQSNQQQMDELDVLIGKLQRATRNKM